MIIEALFAAMFALIAGLLGALPDAGTIDYSGVGSAYGAMLMLDSVFPVHEGLAMVGVLVAVNAGIAGYGVIRTVWRYIPVLGS